jgi:hypothetical protein
MTAESDITQLHTYVERATVIYNPDGSQKGSETHVHTGYFEERSVSDASEGRVNVFQVIKSEVRPVQQGDFKGFTDSGISAIEDLSIKTAALHAAEAKCAAHEEAIRTLTLRAEKAECEVKAQSDALIKSSNDARSVQRQREVERGVSASFRRVVDAVYSSALKEFAGDKFEQVIAAVREKVETETVKFGEPDPVSGSPSP